MLLLTLNLNNAIATGSLTGLKGTVSSSGAFVSPVYTGSSSIVGDNGLVVGAGAFTIPAFTGSATITGLIGIVISVDSIKVYPQLVLIKSKINTDLKMNSTIINKMAAKSKVTTEINLTSLI